MVHGDAIARRRDARGWLVARQYASVGAGGAYGGMGTRALCTAGAAGAASSWRCVRQQEHADGEDGGQTRGQGSEAHG